MEDSCHTPLPFWARALICRLASYPIELHWSALCAYALFRLLKIWIAQPVRLGLFGSQGLSFKASIPVRCIQTICICYSFWCRFSVGAHLFGQLMRKIKGGVPAAALQSIPLELSPNVMWCFYWCHFTTHYRGNKIITLWFLKMLS